MKMTSFGLLDFDLHLLERKMQGKGAGSRRGSAELLSGYKSDTEAKANYDKFAQEQKGNFSWTVSRLMKLMGICQNFYRVKMSFIV